MYGVTIKREDPQHNMWRPMPTPSPTAECTPTMMDSHIQAFSRYLAEAAGIEPSDQHHTRAYLIAWLHSNYEVQGATSMTKEDLYQDYLTLCAQEAKTALLPSMFGKLVHRAFPGLRSSRVGARGLSKHCYKCFRRRRTTSTITASSSSLASSPSSSLSAQIKNSKAERRSTRRRSLSLPSMSPADLATQGLPFSQPLSFVSRTAMAASRVPLPVATNYAMYSEGCTSSCATSAPSSPQPHQAMRYHTVATPPSSSTYSSSPLPTPHTTLAASAPGHYSNSSLPQFIPYDGSPSGPHHSVQLSSGAFPQYGSSAATNRPTSTLSAEDLAVPAYISPLEVSAMTSPATFPLRSDSIGRASIEMETFRSFLSMLGAPHASSSSSSSWAMINNLPDQWEADREWCSSMLPSDAFSPPLSSNVI